MDGIIVNYRRGRKTATPNQLIIQVDGISSKKSAAKIIGKKVVWKTRSGKNIAGKIAQAHGSKGAVRARFTKGLPGQCIGTKITVS